MRKKKEGMIDQKVAGLDGGQLFFNVARSKRIEIGRTTILRSVF